MNMNDYAAQAIATLTNEYDYGDITPQLMGQVLGLADESGEVLAKFKKILRDKKGVLSDEDKKEIVKELGDILWYVNAVAHLLDSSLEEVARKNNEKLLSRQQRNVLGGSGDNR
jgi:NTP pyrophosphatase (non-canonical NTP hydrolase)